MHIACRSHEIRVVVEDLRVKTMAIEWSCESVRTVEVPGVRRTNAPHHRRRIAYWATHDEVGVVCHQANGDDLNSQFGAKASDCPKERSAVALGDEGVVSSSAPVGDVEPPNVAVISCRSPHPPEDRETV